MEMEKYKAFITKEKETLKKYSDKDIFLKNENKQYYSVETLFLYHELLKDISILLKELNYLKGNVYSDELADLIEEEKEEI